MMLPMDGSTALLLPLSVAGVATGIGMLWRGMGGYRMAVTLGDTSTSRIASLAAGEVRVSGTIEASEATLVSPLQSRPCVWYRSKVRSRDLEGADVFSEERALGFRVRDADGTRIRVFPRGARFAAAARFKETTGFADELPPGYWPRTGSTYGPASAMAIDANQPATELDPAAREAAIAALLTVHQPTDANAEDATGTYGAGGRSFEEARLEPGDAVTVVGLALPFGHLPDPFGADRMDRAGDPLTGLDDPTVAAELEAARAAGTLLTPEEAWGNAAIPGFGIGRPVTQPELDPAATAPVLAAPAAAVEAKDRFDIAPDTLVLAASDGVALLIAEGIPEAAVAREQGTFLVGLLGAALAVASAIVAAVVLGGAAA